MPTLFFEFCYFNISLNLYRVPSYLFMVPNRVLINWRRGFETTYSCKSKKKQKKKKKKKKKKKHLTHTSAGDKNSCLHTHAKAKKKKKKIPVDLHFNWRTTFQDYVLTKKSQLIHSSTDKQGFEFTYSCKIPVDLYINCRIRQTRFSNLVKPSWSQINGRPEISCIKVTPPRNYWITFSEIKTSFCWIEKNKFYQHKKQSKLQLSPLSPHFKVYRQIS